MKILILRTDRLGDTILASPVWQALKEARPEAEVTFLTRKHYGPLFENDPLLHQVLTLPEEGPGAIDELAARLSGKDFDALLALYVDGDVAGLVRKTKVPLKAGPLSKPRTWFLFNRPVRQKRSQSRMHEADYNGLLLEALGIPYRPLPPRVHLPEGEEAGEDALLARLLGERREEAFLVVHPGMGGSAVNWPSARYAALVEEVLRHRGETVVVTGTDQDREYLSPLAGLQHPRLVNAAGRLNLVELSLLLRRAALFVGPSTGPMHLATALDTPVVTIFSPLQVQQPRRWGPYRSRGTVLAPPVDCPEKHHCRKERCHDYDCMEKITVEEACQAVTHWLEQSG